MIIRFETQEEKIEIVSRFDMKLVSKNVDKIADVGAKTLPINLNDVFKKALTFGQNVTKEELQKKAKNNLVDVHYFPIKYKNNNSNKELAYVDYNLRSALVAMLEMEQALQWLVGYNENVQFVVERRDVEKTLWSVANRLSDNKEIKTKEVATILEVYDNIDAKFMASHFNDFWWNVDWFIGKDRYLKDVTNYEIYDTSKYVGVYVYGAKRNDSWSTITHKEDDSLCLYIDNKTKMMLKRIKNSMSGQKFHDYLNNLIGKWFDLNDKKMWDAIRQNMKRIDDSELDPMFEVGVCDMAVKDYFEKLGELCYNGKRVDEEETPVVVEKEEIVEEDLFDEIVEETIANENQYKYTELTKDLEQYEEGSDEWWAALSKV